MNKTFAFLFAVTITTAAIIMPCCLGLTPPSGTYTGTDNSVLGSPSITFSPINGSSWSSFFVGNEYIHGFLEGPGNSAGPSGLFLYNSGNLTLGLTASATGPSGPTTLGGLATLMGDEVLTSVSYQASWLEQPVVIYAENISSPNAVGTFAYNLSLPNIPEGRQQITVTAIEEGYVWAVTSYQSFSTSTSGVFNFNVVPLSVSFISPVEGQVFNSSEVPLVFNVNESSPQWLGIRLDNQDIEELAGNTTYLLFANSAALSATLIGFANGTALTNGHYSLTIYAEDSFGNIGKSEPINFTIAEPEPTHPFPTATVAVISVVAVAIVCIGLALLFYRRRHGKTANLSK